MGSLGHPSFLHVGSEDSDQTDLSLRWAHMLFCWFCYEAAQKDFDGVVKNPVSKHSQIYRKTNEPPHDKTRMFDAGIKQFLSQLRQVTLFSMSLLS